MTNKGGCAWRCVTKFCVNSVALIFVAKVGDEFNGMVRDDDASETRGVKNYHCCNTTKTIYDW